MEVISVIIPVYNAEKYLTRCVESIRSQTYNSLEIILINDGSKDNSGQICDSLALLDSRIRVFHKENGGVSSARNIGLDMAIGDYIFFVDADDTIQPDTLNIMLQAIHKTQSDISVCGYITLSTNGDLLSNHAIPESKTVEKDELVRSAIFGCWDRTEPMIPVSIWGKLYKKHLWDKKRFNVFLTISEDAAAWIQIAQECNRCALCSGIAYEYYIYENSAYHKNPLSTKKRELDAAEYICQIVADTEYRQYGVQHLLTIFLSYFYALVPNKDKQEYIRICNTLRKYDPMIHEFSHNFPIKWKIKLFLFRHMKLFVWNLYVHKYARNVSPNSNSR